MAGVMWESCVAELEHHSINLFNSFSTMIRFHIHSSYLATPPHEANTSAIQQNVKFNCISCDQLHVCRKIQSRPAEYRKGRQAAAPAEEVSK
ncbi:hypothetical protein E2C01_049707 [Portunus trituberculatus]|uniref:Uncharacterized protein n=1 Tax=Portunus trituberculatus TaxID=210409 RepID=A0A5B7GEK9_PORTR|nr:hypothetical protein [Portunus trituberculatus]